jgi:uncharacterized membrane protein YbjE (DUF340 family)
VDPRPILVLAGGVAAGALGLIPQSWGPLIDGGVQAALAALFVCIGIEVGRDEQFFSTLSGLRTSSLITPAASLLGSILGGGAAAALMGFPVALGAAAGAGCGYYSITSILLKEIAGPEAAAVGFLANMLRESAIIVAMPLFVRFLGPKGAVGAAGATAMDTALPFIIRSAGKSVALLSFASGIVLTLVVPFVIPFLYRILS